MGKPPKKPKHNASAKSVDTGVKSVPQVDVKNTTNSVDAGNANMVVASGSIDAVVESETHDNACNAVDAAIHSTGNGKINTGDAVETTAATANSNIASANTTGVINRTNTTETSVAGVANSILNANINQDKEGAVDVLVQVSVHMRTLFYKYQILSQIILNLNNLTYML
jgi:hypothetical protein